MKYSQYVGFAASLALIAVCYLPWIYIASKNIIVTGMNAPGTNFGRPGLMNIILNLVIALLFLLPFIPAKRVNVLLAALNLGWSIRNFLLLTTCIAGECPEKREGIYLLLTLAAVIQLMTFFPKINMKEERQ
jgi:uncharacterized membrane protein YuzA (DUF378 family)